MKPVKKGDIGELFIGGPGIARGYLNQKELSSKSFLKDIFSNNGSRLYRSGDLVQENSDGEFLFHGRIDGQVKIRGYRTELSEIEKVLNEHPNIQNSVVTVHKGNGAEDLAAYVIPEKSKSLIDSDGILKMLQKRLPAYMVPSYLDTITELPLLSSGKIDKKMLPEPHNPPSKEK